MAKIKILYIITKSNWGGAQRYVFDLATHLPQETFDTMVAAGGSGNLFSRLGEQNIRTMRIPHLEKRVRIADELRAFRELVRMLWRERPHVIHLNSSKIGLLGAIAGRIARVPTIIFTAHGWPFYEERGSIANSLIWLASWITSLLSHYTIILSKFDFKASQIFPLISKRKFIFIPNGIDEESVVFAARAEARRELGLEVPENSFVVGCITEFTKNKGTQYAVEALARLPQNVKLVLLGDGEEKHEAETTAVKFGVRDRVYFTGFKENAGSLLKAFDLFMFPSIKEGLPYALLEAGLAELPIIASHVGGIPDIIENGKDGILVEPKNAKGLSKAVNQLMEDPAKGAELGTHAREKIRESFSFSTMLDRTRALYRG